MEQSQTFDYFRVQSLKIKRFGLNCLEDFRITIVLKHLVQINKVEEIMFYVDMWHLSLMQKGQLQQRHAPLAVIFET